MRPDGTADLTIPVNLRAQLEATAAAQHRPAAEVLRVALEQYLDAWRSKATRSPAEAAARMRQSRTGNILPDGTTLRDLMIHGRA